MRAAVDGEQFDLRPGTDRHHVLGVHVTFEVDLAPHDRQPQCFDIGDWHARGSDRSPSPSCGWPRCLAPAPRPLRQGWPEQR